MFRSEVYIFEVHFCVVILLYEINGFKSHLTSTIGMYGWKAIRVLPHILDNARKTISVRSYSGKNGNPIGSSSSLHYFLVGGWVDGCKKIGTKVFFNFAKNLTRCAFRSEVFISEVHFCVAILILEKNGFRNLC